MIYLAFPGMGKTPLSKKSGKYLDLDFGHYREANQVSKDNELELMPSFARLAEMYAHDGFVVLSNDPKLMDFTRVDRVYLPVNANYAARKLNVSPTQIRQWVESWREKAEEHAVPVVYVTGGLDHYLDPRVRRNRKGGATS